MAQLTPSQVSRFAKLTATATLPVGGLGRAGVQPSRHLQPGRRPGVLQGVGRDHVIRTPQKPVREGWGAEEQSSCCLCLP